MSIAISDVIASAETIRTNNLPDSNTPELVGSTIKGILSLLQDLQIAKNSVYYLDVSYSDAQRLPSSPTDKEKLTAYLIGSYVYVWNGTSWIPKQFTGNDGKKGNKGDSGVTDAASVVAISDYTAGDGTDATKVYVGTATALKNLYLYTSGLISQNTQNIGTNDYDDYDATQPYKADDIRQHDGYLWKCNTDIATAETWNESHWTKISVNGILKDIISTLLDKNTFKEFVATNGTELKGKSSKDELAQAVNNLNVGISKKLDSSKINILSEDAWDALPTKVEGTIYLIY